MKKPTILILGVQSMLGHTIFNYLNNRFAKQVWGTTRTGQFADFKLDVATVDTDFITILKKLDKIDYVINCIGLIKNATRDELIKVNTLLPRKLSGMSKKYDFSIIHISTDGVFDELAGEVTEDNYPHPSSTYGKSKLAGEQISKNILSFRTSLLGLDPYKHNGLLEWALQKENLYGYTNQLWSGCTTLQLACLIEKIFLRDAFASLRKKSPVFHFAPLSGTSKYEILTKFFTILKKKIHVIPTLAKVSINRQLITNYPKELWYNSFTQDISHALKELILFENYEK